MAVTETPLGPMVAAIAERARTDQSFRDLRHAIHREGSRVLRAVLEGATTAGVVQPGLDVDRAVGQLVGPLFYRYLFDDVRLTRRDSELAVDAFLASVA